MDKGSYFSVFMLILLIPRSMQLTKKKEPIKDCSRDMNKSGSCQNTTQIAIALANQTVTEKPKLAEFQIDEHKTVSISRSDLNDLLEVYISKLADNAATISEKDNELTKLQSLNQSYGDAQKKYQELLETCTAQSLSINVTLSDKDKQIKILQSNYSIYEFRLKRKQHLLGVMRKLNATNVAKINDLKSRILFLEARLKERKEDLLADWEAATNSCLPFATTMGIRLMELPNFRPFLVPCEKDGWTVIQRRLDGSVDFYRNWAQYSGGFGKLNGEFFIGLEKLHRLTTFQPHELHVSLRLFNGTYRYALYDNFVIGSEEEGYVLKDLGRHAGNASDALRTHDKMKFSTFDRDNDDFTHMNCAVHHHGAWWYDYCSRSNLNGRYFKKQIQHAEGIFWETWYSFKSLKSVQMQIRPTIAKLNDNKENE